MRAAFAAVLSAVIGSSSALAEGTGGREKMQSSASRLRGVSTIATTSSGALLSLGGSNLRILAPGSKSWQSLYQIPGGNLYRVASNDSGGILAAWETEAVVHYFHPKTLQHVALPRPQAPPPGIKTFGLQYLDFAPDGRHALIRMEGSIRHTTGSWHGDRKVYVMYRVPLDGNGPPEHVYTVDGSLLVYMSPRLGIFLDRVTPGPECGSHTTCDYRSITAYELTDSGVTRKVLLTNQETRITGARRASNSNDERVVLQLGTDAYQVGRAVLLWRRGAERAQVIKGFPGRIDARNRMLVLKSGAIVELVRLENREELMIRSLAPGASRASEIKLRAPEDPDTVDTEVHGLGERSDGTLWAHWGDFILLFPPGKPPRAHSIARLLGRRDEWGGVGIYVKEPEALWLAVEVGAGRDFVRIELSELEKKARPWPTY